MFTPTHSLTVRLDVDGAEEVPPFFSGHKIFTGPGTTALQLHKVKLKLRSFTVRNVAVHGRTSSSDIA